MNEHLLYLGKVGGGDWPTDTKGPGPSQLIGYTEEDDKGFFGEVPNSHLISPVNLPGQLGVTEGTAQNTGTPWLKFYLDGRILYVTKKTIRHSISYVHLRDKGLVDGSKIINIAGRRYKVGLLSGIDDDYGGTVIPGFNQPYTMRSEWTRLMYNVSAEVNDARYHKQGQIGDNWVSYPQDNSANGLNITAGNGATEWTRGLDSIDLTQAVNRGYYSVSHMSYTNSSLKRTYEGWRPMLELIKE